MTLPTRPPGKMYGADFYQTTEWRGNDGRVYQIKDMTTSHIQNTINLLGRKRHSFTFQMMILSGFPNPVHCGDATRDQLDAEYDKLSFDLVEGNLRGVPLCDALLKEQALRGFEL